MPFTRSVNCCDDEDVFDNASSDGTEDKCPDLCLSGRTLVASFSQTHL